MNEIRVESMAEYVQNVCKLQEEYIEYNPIKNPELLFRGQADKNYSLVPAIGREQKNDCDCTLFKEERNLIESAKYKLPDVFRSDMSPIELLALLQHHGVPTRLLDVTENPLVALYFACNKNKGKDAEVIVFKNEKMSVTNYPIVNAIADSYRFTETTWTPLADFYGDIKNQVYFMEQKRQLSICHNDDVDGGKWIAECCEKIIYIYAPIRSMRQQVQQGRYILFPNCIEYELDDNGEFGSTIAEIPKDHEDIVARIIIPADIKSKLLKDLSTLGIREDVLFCDNVDTVCSGVVSSFARKYRREEDIRKL